MRRPIRPVELDLEPYSAGDLAALFGVDGRTIRRWDTAGKLPGAFRTLGGHRRFNRTAVDALLAGSTAPRQEV